MFDEDVYFYCERDLCYTINISSLEAGEIELLQSGSCHGARIFHSSAPVDGSFLY